MTALSKFKRAQGFITGRNISTKDEEAAERDVETEMDIVNGAIAYVTEVMGPDKRSFRKQGYNDCLLWLSKRDKRSESATNALATNAMFTMFSGVLMEDNWVHVRYLLEALRLDFKRGPADAHQRIEALDDGERALMCIFALLRVGADDPLPWFLALDGQLRIMWRAITGEDGTIRVKNIDCVQTSAQSHLQNRNVHPGLME